MPVRIAINGLGRIGRQVLRIGIGHPELQFVALNDPAPADHLEYLLRFDSSHGRFTGTVEVQHGILRINQQVAYSTAPVVSSDFRGCSHSAVFDESAGAELNPHSYRLVAWFDSEWAFASRIVDFIRFAAQRDDLI